MKVAFKDWWEQLSPEMRAWLLGALHAMGVAAINSLMASPWTNWKGILAVAASSAITGFKLYKAQSPFPRQVWTDAQRGKASNTTSAGG